MIMIEEMTQEWIQNKYASGEINWRDYVFGSLLISINDKFEAVTTVTAKGPTAVMTHEVP
jgi:hypothetical protein